MKQRRKCNCGGYMKFRGWIVEEKFHFLGLEFIYWLIFRPQSWTSYYVYECVKCGKLKEIKR